MLVIIIFFAFCSSSTWPFRVWLSLERETVLTAHLDRAKFSEAPASAGHYGCMNANLENTLQEALQRLQHDGVGSASIGCGVA